MKQAIRLSTMAVALTALLALAAPAARAAIPAQVGPYKVTLTTQPTVIPVGKVRLTVQVADPTGRPVDGAQVRSLVKMPTMNMGEKETVATPVAGQPGTYVTDAAFMMAGSYDATLTISGPQGTGTGKVALQTGQDTSGGAGGFSLVSLLPWLAALAIVAFVLYRLRVTGQRPDWRHAVSRGTLGGLVLLVAMLAGSLYAINHWRRPGAMTPLEAQGMEMNTPAPPGTAAVLLAPVTRGPIQRTIRYTGQAVGFNEQDVSARTQGWLTWMPYYVGSRVRAGQVVGRLDTSQQTPQVAERQANVTMASQGVDVAQREYQQALAGVNQARAEVAGKRDAVAGAQADAAAAQEDLANAQADVAAMQTQVTNAQAALDATRADQQYWQQEIQRERTLYDKGVVSKDEYQKEQSQAAAADSKVSQAQAGVAQAQAQVRAAEARVRKAQAGITSANKKAQQMASDARAGDAAVRSAQAGADAARQKITQAIAGVSQARAVLSSATTARGYAEVRSLTNGVITQRLVSPGTLVSPGQAIVRVAQISPIRLQANVSQDDLASVRVGSRVTVRGQNGAGSPIVARVTSITPAVDPVARTGVVEAVVPNADGRFLPGQFVVMDISTGTSREGLRVPTQAVRTRTNTTTGLLAGEGNPYVWVAAPVEGQDGQYTVQPVDIQTGASDGTYTEVLSGLSDGQQVVTIGADYLKAGDTVAGSQPHEETAATEATVEVSSAGFTPSNLTLKAGVPVKVTFVRKDEQNCGTEVLFPDYGIRRALPLNQPVVLQFTPRKGEFGFTCGMGMLRGRVVAR